jgi:hypothetical protein
MKTKDPQKEKLFTIFNEVMKAMRNGLSEEGDQILVAAAGGDDDLLLKMLRNFNKSKRS